MEHSLNSSAVFRFAQGTNGKIWVSTGGGINIFDPATGKFDTLSALSCIKKIADNHDLSAILIDTISRKVLLEHPGMLEIDLDTKKCLPIIFKDSAGYVINRSANDGNISLNLKMDV